MDVIVTEKKCWLCKEIKPVSEFYKNSSRKDGLCSECKECKRKSNKEWTSKNPEIKKVLERKWILENKEKRKNYLKDYLKKYRTTKLMSGDSKVSKDFSKKAASSSRKYYSKNIEKERLRQKKYTQLHPEKTRFRAKNRKARIKGANGKITYDEWKTVLEKYKYTCLCCKRNDVVLTMDHVVPLVFGGRNTIDNIQPLCKSCNSRKNTKIIDYR